MRYISLLKKVFQDKAPDIALRYYPIVKKIESDGLKCPLILEVGSGSKGIAPYLNRKITGVDIIFRDQEHALLRQIVASADSIPMRDNSFDYVICVDVLEHIPKYKRKKVINEIFRVGRKVVFIAFPTGKGSEEEDKFGRKLFNERMGHEDPYLNEHKENGLPDRDSFIKWIKGYNYEEIKNSNLLVHRYLLFFQISKKKTFRFISSIVNNLLVPYFVKITFGKCYRRLFIIEL